MIRHGSSKKGNTAESKTWTIYQKAIFVVRGLSLTWPITFAASSSPDFGSLPTRSWALGPFSPSLPLAGLYWNDKISANWKYLNLNPLRRNIIISLNSCLTVLWCKLLAVDKHLKHFDIKHWKKQKWGEKEGKYLEIFATEERLQKTWTISQKAIFGLCWLSRTRTMTSTASSSPDSMPLATCSWAVGPGPPFLPFAWLDRTWNEVT